MCVFVCMFVSGGGSICGGGGGGVYVGGMCV